MINYGTITKEVPVIISKTCDVCKKTFSIDDVLSKGINELEAFYHISFDGGYGSVFGDGNTVSLDICQYCLNEKLGSYMRKSL
jgi:hypothetical protein